MGPFLTVHTAESSAGTSSLKIFVFYSLEKFSSVNSFKTSNLFSCIFLFD